MKAAAISSSAITPGFRAIPAAIAARNGSVIERIVRFTEERYFDTATSRMVAVGRHGERLVLRVVAR